MIRLHRASFEAGCVPKQTTSSRSRRVAEEHTDYVRTADYVADHAFRRTAPFSRDNAKQRADGRQGVCGGGQKEKGREMKRASNLAGG